MIYHSEDGIKFLIKYIISSSLLYQMFKHGLNN